MNGIALARDIAIDLGTSTTRLLIRGRAVIAEPTVVALDSSGEVVDIGEAALRRAAVQPTGAVRPEGSADQVGLVWPVRHGAIADVKRAQQFVTQLLRKEGGSGRRRVVVCTPSSIGAVDSRAIRELVKRAGAAEVHLLQQAIAAALGAGLPVHEPVGTMVVLAGAGSTEATVLSLGSVVTSSRLRVGSGDVDAAIRSNMRRRYGLAMGLSAAEQTKLVAVRALVDEQLVNERANLFEVQGISTIDGSAMTAILELRDIRPEIDDYVNAVVECVRQALVATPPELSQDLIIHGIYVAGAAARLGLIGQRLQETFRLPVHVIESPERAVVEGAGKCLEALDRLSSLFIGEQ